MKGEPQFFYLLEYSLFSRSFHSTEEIQILLYAYALLHFLYFFFVIYTLNNVHLCRLGVIHKEKEKSGLLD